MLWVYYFYMFSYLDTHTQITSKLITHTPPAELVDAYLGEIAKGYGVDWTPQNEENNGGDGGEGGVKVRPFR